MTPLAYAEKYGHDVVAGLLRDHISNGYVGAKERAAIAAARSPKPYGGGQSGVHHRHDEKVLRGASWRAGDRVTVKFDAVVQGAPWLGLTLHEVLREEGER